MTQAMPIHDTKPTPTRAAGTQTEPSGCASGCSDVPELTRLRYFHGRALSALDLRREQSYGLDKDRLRNRLLHGWGIICGLEIEVLPPGECDPCDEGPAKVVVRVHPGAAIDCDGNEIIVRRPRDVVVESLLREEDRKRLADAPAAVYLSLCFHEELIDPSRPLLTAGCEPVPSCEYGRVRETYRICGSLTRPDAGPACEPCCGGCGSGDRCLELVALAGLTPGKPGDAIVLDPSGRRPLAKHDLAEVSAINWVHGATYSRDGATTLFAEGAEVRFSRPIQVSSLRPGVVELTVVEAGGGRAAGMYDLQGEFVDLPTEPGALTDRFTFRSTSDETLQYGDKVMVQIRGDFIVDECCRALDGNHVGGAVPALAECPADPVEPPGGPPCPPRPSGNGTEGGEFVSWVFVQARSGNGKNKNDQGADPKGEQS